MEPKLFSFLNRFSLRQAERPPAAREQKKFLPTPDPLEIARDADRFALQDLPTLANELAAAYDILSSADIEELIRATKPLPIPDRSSSYVFKVHMGFYSGQYRASAWVPDRGEHPAYGNSIQAAIRVNC